MRRTAADHSRLTAAVFLLLVGATITAFFAAQRLKHQPPLLRQKAGDRAFSPNGDGVKDTARIKFKLPEQDDVTVTILDDDGGIVARVARNMSLAGQKVHTLHWDGRTSEGTTAPEGTYSVRVGLRKGGRTATLAREIELDLEPPKVRLAPVRGPSRGPFVIDGQLRRGATVRLAGPGRKPSFSVWRTDRRQPEEVVAHLPLTGDRSARWDGRIGGRQAPPGTYLIAGEGRDPAGNPGTAPAELPPAETSRAPGGVGVVVRPVAITPPVTPVRAGRTTRVTVEAGGRRYRWTLRRLGGGASRGRSKARRLRLRIPPGRAGVYVLTVEAGRHTARAVVPASSGQPRRVLLVLPKMTWQGRNDVDDTGDGLPDSLSRGRSAGFTRPFANGRLPRGFGSSEAPLIRFLERNRLRYDVATDIGLARSTQVPFVGYDGVVLAGDTEWFQDSLGKQLRAFVERGGRVLTLGTESLRRTALIRGGRLRKPSEPSDTDIFGAEIGELRRSPLELLVQSDRLRLFAGTAGSVGQFEAWEPTTAVERLAAVAGETGGDPVFVAYRLGRGIVFRPGVTGFPLALGDDVGPAAETMKRIWTLLG